MPAPARADNPDLTARLAAVAGRSTLRITTRGRRTGRPHTVTIWFVVEGATLHLGTLSTTRDWVRNVVKDPDVTLSVDGLRIRGRAVRITEPRDDAHVRALLARKYWLAWIGSWFGKGPAATFHVDRVELA